MLPRSFDPEVTVITPDAPLDNAGALTSATDPDPAVKPLPDNTFTAPPPADAAPPTTNTELPTPVEDQPAITLIAPAFPAFEAGPDDSRTYPELPAEASPETTWT